MKNTHLYLFLFSVFLNTLAFSQNIQVSETAFTPQELIENVLINNGCITDIQVTNVVGGNFTDGSLSYGYFNANGSSFPFAEGLVLSSGKLSNTVGPNDSLSDDDAPGWTGDADLEAALAITNTTNATIIEFDFIPTADFIRFRYLFASEEYQEGDPNTCRFSDAFGFLIRPVGGTYSNLALVPGTSTPVAVTTVHPEIPGGCPAINESFFGSFNGLNVPINFNGQTAILTAESQVIPNETYQIKLVIADEENFRFDSAVFLEANSFSIGADIGRDRLFATNNPLCDEEVLVLDATPPNSVPQGYRWFRNGTLLPAETDEELTVTTAGTYRVEVDYGGGCLGEDEVVIEYAPEVVTNNTELFQCEEILDGIAIFNLFDTSERITNANEDLQVISFHERRQDAEIGFDPIPNPTAYQNPTPNQIVYARVEDNFGCSNVASVILRTTDAAFGDFNLAACSFQDDGDFGVFNLSEITPQIEAVVTSSISITYHESFEDAVSNQDELLLQYTSTVPNMQTVYARINGLLGCQGIATVQLEVVETPQFEAQTPIYYCLNTFPDTIEITSGVIGNEDDFTYQWSTGETTPTIDINEIGTYEVIVTNIQVIAAQTLTCTATNTITVLPSEIAEFTVAIDENLGGNSIVIVTATGVGDYLYALDDPLFTQESNIFENVSGGAHTVFVIDKNGCGIASEQIFVLEFPQFFTPNQDGFHDTWQVDGLNAAIPQVQRIEIFNQYGKLLKVISPQSAGWDGTYNGTPLPSNDYWFVAHFFDAPSYRSHFTLKR